MYRRILLAYDGSKEGRAALREGALLALRCRAKIFLLSVVGGEVGVRLAEGIHSGPIASQFDQYQAILDEGVDRLKEVGFSVEAKLVVGAPVSGIRDFANEVRADLVVVGHRRKSFVERWWSEWGEPPLVDQIACSLLIARNVITEEQFKAELQRMAEADPVGS